MRIRAALTATAMLAAAAWPAGCGGAADDAPAEPASFATEAPPEVDRPPDFTPAAVDPGGTTAGHVLAPSKAGTWYPGSAAAIAAKVDGWLNAPGALPEIPGRPVALIVPHAGWRFSGAIAGAGFRAVRHVRPETVVLLGVCHHSRRAGLEGTTLLRRGAMETPLGRTAVDPEVATEIGHTLHDAVFNAAAFEGEHSLEVVLPFVQRAWPRARIVPLLVNAKAYNDFFRVATAVADAVEGLSEERKILLVASSDLAHGAGPAATKRIDAATVEAWRSLDPRIVHWHSLRTVKDGRDGCTTTMCGADPVIATLWAARRLGATTVTTVAQSTSADTEHHKAGMSVVGYAAAVVSASDPSPDMQRSLLALARAAATAELGLGEAPDLAELPAPLTTNLGGAFVTIRRGGVLHGCVGRTATSMPAGELSASLGRAAARDDRAAGAAVTADDLPGLHFEISLLSKLERVRDLTRIVPGVHGVRLEYGTGESQRTAVYLPQVAMEQDWDRDTLLRKLAAKAGLNVAALHAPEARVYRFTAFVFAE
jgi:AmmeMemoRadiSam system protein B